MLFAARSVIARDAGLAGSLPRPTLPSRARKTVGRLGAHNPSHLGLLVALPDRPVDPLLPSSPELIVLPTIRPLEAARESIEATLRLAERVGARVLILCSGEGKAQDFAALDLAPQRVPIAVLDWTTAPVPRTASLSTSDHMFARLPWRRGNDVAAKRNYGLLVARRLGCRTVLFLDDDVRAWTPAELSECPGRGPTLTVVRLRQAVQALHRDRNLRAVGWILREFDDNSVVCHARKLVQLPQSSFISAGALLVRSDEWGFFPESIYNEDWFFLYASLTGARGRGRLGVAGTVCQREYDPFTRRRALSEEVGDLVAEGLFALLRRSGAVDPLRFSTPYWEQVVQYRRSMIDDVVRLVKGERDGLEKTREGRRLQDALVALKAASGVYRIACGGKSTNIAAHAVSYVRALEADVATWARVMRTASWDDVTAPIRDPMCATVYGVPNADAWLAGGPVKGGAAAIDKDREAQLAGTARD